MGTISLKMQRWVDNDSRRGGQGRGYTVRVCVPLEDGTGPLVLTLPSRRDSRVSRSSHNEVLYNWVKL